LVEDSRSRMDGAFVVTGSECRTSLERVYNLGATMTNQ
jgi:hypothetical protein